jgi:crossover junction endodeoxyribonuclease RuvC
MRVLGIDPGSTYMGLGCVEVRGSKLICIGHKLVRAKSANDESWGSRLKIIYQSVYDAINLWQPNVASVEKVFFAKNADSALKLGQARGAALAAVAMQDLEIAEYPATTIKQAITSSGRAEKEQVFQMVKLLLGDSLKAAGELERHDSSDALAIAICHTQQRKFPFEASPRGR